MTTHLLLDVSLRLVVALLLGGLVGLEREYRSKDAGFRTHFLVAVGSAMFTIISIYGFVDGVKDTSRVAAQVVSGIGFLGAGLIVFQKNVVRGLTTAAGLWVTAAIGMACGTGMYAVAAVVTVLILIGLEVLNGLIPQLGTSNVQLSFSSPSHENAIAFVDRIKRENVHIYNYEMKSKRTSRGEIYEVEMDLRMPKGQSVGRLLDGLIDFDNVTLSSVD
ncbi:MAG: MgtC/SapB family protein [Prevotella sp.]|nr:MgtC/SapB family protein [Prevotella sp.]